MGNSKPVLYVGVTNDLHRRVLEHKKGTNEGFTKKYGLKKLLYFETGTSSLSAIIREKQIKNMSREEKLKLIMEMNPKFRDLTPDIFNV